MDAGLFLCPSVPFQASRTGHKRTPPGSIYRDTEDAGSRLPEYPNTDPILPSHLPRCVRLVPPLDTARYKPLHTTVFPTYAPWINATGYTPHQISAQSDASVCIDPRPQAAQCDSQLAHYRTGSSSSSRLASSSQYFRRLLRSRTAATDAR